MEWVLAVHVLFLAGVVTFAHHPAVFMGLLLFFLGFAAAYPQFQDRLMLRERLMVAFFLAGLVGLSDDFKYSVVAGAVTGGGLTVIANAPTPPASRSCVATSTTRRFTRSGCSSRRCRPRSQRCWLSGCSEENPMALQWLRELWDWWAILPREMLFFFSLPFMVAAAALLADGYRRRRRSP
jgi:hypothetical protein